MKAISQLVVHVADLLEAEGRTLLSIIRDEGKRVQQATMSAAVAVMFLVMTVPFVLAGFGLLATGLLWGLEPVVGRALAAVATGVALLVIGGCCLGLFRSFSRRPGS